MSSRSLRFLLSALILCVLTGASARALQITSATLDPSPFSPNPIRDGFKDTTYAYFTLSDPATSVNLAISAPLAGGGAGSLTLVVPGPFEAGSHRLGWDGNIPGALVADGPFAIRISAYGPSGADSVTREGTIDLTGPSITFIRLDPSSLVYCGRSSDAAPKDSTIISVAIKDFNASGNPMDHVLIWIERTYTTPPTSGSDRDETLYVKVANLRSVDTLRVVWRPASDTLDPVLDGPHNVHVELSDFAGNRSSQVASVDVDQAGVRLVATVPAGGFVRRSRVQLILNSIPDTLRGFVSTRHSIAEIHARFGGRSPQPVTLFSRGDSTYWFVPTDKGALANGYLEAEIFAQDGNGCVEHDSIRIKYDTIPPPPPTLFAEIPPVTHRALLVVRGVAASSDSLVRQITYPDGSIRRLTRFIATPGNTDFTFTDSLILKPGINNIQIRGKDAAGNLGESVATAVNYVVTDGIGAPQLFRAGDAFRARLDRIISSLRVRIYRPDGGFVRELLSERPLDGASRDFETVWDLKNGDGATVGKGPHICILTVTYQDGSTTSKRLAVIAAP